MKRLTSHAASPLRTRRPSLVLALFVLIPLQSCILDAPGDQFYRTLWISDEVPLGTFKVSTLTLEFLCNDLVSIKTTSPQRSSLTNKIISGRYEFNGATASLQNLSFILDDQEITFIQAQKNGDALILLWQLEDSEEIFTTPLKRLSAYPDEV